MILYTVLWSHILYMTAVTVLTRAIEAEKHLNLQDGVKRKWKYEFIYLKLKFNSFFQLLVYFIFYEVVLWFKPRSLSELRVLDQFCSLGCGFGYSNVILQYENELLVEVLVSKVFA